MSDLILQLCILAGVAEVVGGATAIILADIAGRRILLALSTFFMGSSMGVLSVMFYLSVDGAATISSLQSILTVVSVILFVFEFAVGIAPIPTFLIGEIFSLQTKSLATTI